MRTLVVVLACAGSVASADTPPDAPPPRRKGVAEPAPADPPPALATGEVLIAAGASAGLDRELGAMPSGRVGFYFPNHVTLAATGSAKQVGTERESWTALLVGYRRAITRGRLAAWLGLEAGGGVALQGVAGTTMAYSPLALVTPYVGASVRVMTDVALGAELTLPEAVMRRDGAFTMRALPAAWIGALFDL